MLHLDFMPFLLPVMVGVVEILVLTSIYLRLGGCLCSLRVVLLNKCLAVVMLHLDFMPFLLPVMAGVVEILVLTSICLTVGRLSMFAGELCC